MKSIFLIIIMLILSNHVVNAQCATPDETIWQNTWESCTTSPNPKSSYGNTHWIQYDFGKVRKLSKSWVWNANDPTELNSGFNLVKIDYSQNGSSWNYWGEMNFPKAVGNPVYGGFSGPDLSNIEAQFVLLTVVSTHGDACAGLAEIKFNLMPDATKLPTAPCQAPNVVNFVHIGATEVFINWNLAYLADEYEIAIGPVGGDWTEFFTIDREFFLNGLQPETTYEFEINVVCGDNFLTSQTFSFTTLEMDPLVVELLEFYGEAQNEAHHLYWTMMSDETGVIYEIEQADSEFEFKKIGRIVGNSADEKFHFVNTQPIIGDNFYRLKIIDSDNKSAYSSIVQLPYQDLLSDITIYPNPTENSVYLELDSRVRDDLTYSLINAQGSLILQQNRTIGQGNNRLRIDMYHLPAGVYWLNASLSSGQHQVSHKVVKL